RIVGPGRAASQRTSRGAVDREPTIIVWILAPSGSAPLMAQGSPRKNTVSSGWHGAGRVRTVVEMRAESAQTDVVFLKIDQSAAAATRPLANAPAMLARERISVVLVSSMTRAELEMVQQTIALREPFICESGAALLVPHGYFSFAVPCDR